MLVDIFNAPENPSWHAAMRAIDDNCCYGIPFDKTRQCCIEGEGVYGEQESWIVKICHGNMDLGPFGHVWIESGKIKKGFTSALDTGIFSVWLDSGKFEDDSYSSREESHEFYSYWFDKNKKYCYPFYLKKCHFDIEKFNSCLEEERPKALYSFMGYPITVIDPAIIINFPNFINEAIIGAYLAIYLPKNIDKLSDRFNKLPIKNCYSAAYHMLAKCAKKAKR